MFKFAYYNAAVRHFATIRQRFLVFEKCGVALPIEEYFTFAGYHVTCLYIYIYIYTYFKIRRSTKRFVFFEFIFLFLHTCYINVCFQLVASVREHMWHKSLLMGYSIRLDLTLVSSINDLWLIRLVYIRVVIPLSWSVFTLVCFTSLWYLICL